MEAEAKSQKEFSLNDLIDMHISNYSYLVGKDQHELEVRFATKGSYKISKIDVP